MFTFLVHAMEDGVRRFTSTFFFITLTNNLGRSESYRIDFIYSLIVHIMTWKTIGVFKLLDVLDFWQKFVMGQCGVFGLIITPEELG